MEYKQIKDIYFGTTIKDKKQKIIENLHEGNVTKLNDVPFANRTDAKKFKTGWFSFLTREKITPKYSPIITENKTHVDKITIMYDVFLVHWNKADQINKEKLNKKFARGKGRPKKRNIYAEEEKRIMKEMNK
jgi:hypothetical protein